MEKLEEVIKEIEQKKSELKTDEEKTAFLLELIEKYNLRFCHKFEGEDEGLLFKDPSTCCGCIEGQKVMTGLFGRGWGGYASLPYVHYSGDRKYIVYLELARIFAKGGKKAIEAKKAAANEAYKKSRRESLIKDFGEDLTKIDGLIERLLSTTEIRPSGGGCSLTDIEVKPEEGVAAYILDKHWWNDNGTGGVGMASIIKVYREGEEDSISMTYRDQYSSERDDWSKQFRKIKIKKITPTEITIEVFPSSEKYSPRELTFKLKKRSK